MAAPEGGHEPYRYDHAKYVVIDDRAVLVTSENFGHTGFPSTGETGNRGWGVVMEEPRLAAYFGDLYQTDISRLGDCTCGRERGTFGEFQHDLTAGAIRTGYFYRCTG